MKNFALMMVLPGLLSMSLVSANTSETEVHYAGVVNGVIDAKYLTVYFNLTGTGYEYLSQDRKITDTPDFIPVLEAAKDTETVVPSAVFSVLHYDDKTIDMLCAHVQPEEITMQSASRQDARYFVQIVYDEHEPEGLKYQCKYSYL